MLGLGLGHREVGVLTLPGSRCRRWGVWQRGWLALWRSRWLGCGSRNTTSSTTRTT